MEILQGYENNYIGEKNSVSIQIETDLNLNKYLKKVIKKVDKLYDAMSHFTKKHEEIIFYHTFRLHHDNIEYCQYVTRQKNVLYETSSKYGANGDNLKYQLQNSLNFLVFQLKNLGDLGWYGVHFINIMMKNNDTIVKVEDDERQKIKKKKHIDEPSAEKNSRYNNSMIQSGGGHQSKKKI